MTNKDDAFWKKITINDLKRLYLIVLKKYNGLDNQEWLPYIIIKEESNRAWLLNVDRKISYKGINPSLFFIWYAYTHLDSTKTNAAHILNEILENTLGLQKKRSQEQQILKAIDKEIGVEEQRIWEGMAFTPKVKKRKNRSKETLVEKTKRLVFERKKKEKEELDRLACERKKEEKEERKRVAIAIAQWEKEKKEKKEKEERDRLTREKEKREKEKRKKAAIAIAQLEKEKKKKEKLKRIEIKNSKKEKQLEIRLSMQRKKEENEAAIQRALRLYDERKDSKKSDVNWVRKKS